MPSETITGALNRDLASGFEQLVCAYQQPLYAFCLRLLGDRHEAEEATQEAFIRAFRALQHYEAGRIADLQPRPWLYRIVLNVARSRVRQRPPAASALDPELLVGSLPAPEDEALRSEARHDLVRALNQLPEVQRVAVLLRHVTGLTYPEVAAALGQPVGTAKSHVHRGIARLRAALYSTEHAR